MCLSHYRSKILFFFFFFASISLVYCRNLTAYVGIYTYLTLRDPVLPSDAIYLGKTHILFSNLRPVALFLMLSLWL
jgi:hypothetical protein